MITKEFLDDKPINNSSDDLLGFTDFAQNIVNILDIIPKNESFNFGFSGDWGSGKTSIKNLCLECIEKNNSFNVIHFSPWNIIKKENLITEFFELLKNAIYRESGNKKILKQLSSYYEILVNSIPSDSFFEKLFKNFTFSFLKARDTVKTQKEKITSFLKYEYYGKPILIIIDDLDRLTNDEICEVLKLIREIADFPSVIYFVIYEKKQVVNAIETELGIKTGEEFLRKFFQLEWSVPLIHEKKIKRYLLDLLKNNKLCKNLLNSEMEEYFYIIFDNCIAEYIKNIRDVKVLYNSFIVRFSLLKDWVNLIDLLALTCFELFKPELYRFIYNHEFKLTSSFGIHYGRDDIDEEIKNLKNASFDDSSYVENVIRELFPKFYNRDFSNKKDHFIKNRNICSSIFFRAYFYQKNDTINSISKEGIQTLLNEMTLKDMSMLFEYFLNDRGWFTGLQNIFMEICQEIESITKERRNVIFRALFLFGNKVYEKKSIWFEKRKSLLSKIMDILKEILRNLSHDESYILLNEFLFGECKLLQVYKFATCFLNEMKILSIKHVKDDLFINDLDLRKILDDVGVLLNKNYTEIQLFDESYDDCVFQFYSMNFPNDISKYYENVIREPESLIHMCLCPSRVALSQNLDDYLKNQFPEIKSLTNRSEEIAHYINDGNYQNLPEHLRNDFVNFIKQMNITKEMLNEKDINYENWRKLYELENS